MARDRLGTRYLTGCSSLRRATAIVNMTGNFPSARYNRDRVWVDRDNVLSEFLSNARDIPA